jgi:ABC-2 type transport system permease protein
MRSLSITWAFYRAAFRGEAQYRVNFLLMALLGILYQGSGIAFLWIVLGQFDTIAGWSFGEVTLLYAMRLLAHTVWVVPGHQLEYLDMAIREGRFDRALVRPLAPFLQVITARFSLNVLGDVVAAVVVLVIALSSVDLDLGGLRGVYFVAAIIGGALAEGAAVLVISALSFRFVQIRAAYHFIDNVYLLFGSYPTRIFGAATSWVLTWVVPVAFVAYIPSSVLLDKTDGLHVPTFVAFLAPAVGALWFAAAYRFWCGQIRHYDGAGS